MIVRRTWTSCAVAMLSLIAFVPAPAWAQAEGREPAGHRFRVSGSRITAVRPDVPNEQLVIEGAHFGRRTGSVSLAGLELSPVLSWSNSQIIVPLPPFPAGSYLLTVARGRAMKEFNVFGVALGAVGPKGDKGDRGEKGETGDKGDKGDPGKDGVNGATARQGQPGQAVPPVRRASSVQSVQPVRKATWVRRGHKASRPFRLSGHVHHDPHHRDDARRIRAWMSFRENGDWGWCEAGLDDVADSGRGELSAEFDGVEYAGGKHEQPGAELHVLYSVRDGDPVISPTHCV